MTATATEPSRGVATQDDRVATRPLAARLLSRPEVGSLIAAIVIFLLFMAVAEPFRNVANVGTILYGASTIGIMAVPVALLMIGGEFDLSAGVAVTTSGLSASLLAWNFGLNVWVGILLALAVSVAIGAFNGWLLLKTGLPSFLVTLGTFFILQGVNLGVTRLLTGNVASADISDMDGFASAQNIFGSEVTLGPVTLKITVLYWVLLTVIAAYVLLRTRAGNWVFAVGGDAAAARAVGVPVRATKIGLFVAVGFCAWLSGMHLLFQFNTVQSGEGVGKEFIFIIAAVIGGCLLTGGYGSVVGASLGALIFGMTQLGINYAGWNPDWFRTFLGVMLLLATLVNMYVKRRADLR
ncbi:ribose ABC transporter permease [Micromonospora globispora]|uniref:Xylose transport system permease protein XylH n=1 Tax=Micromonospora globispora TaxID=1450148 RepID=A0A317JZP6_9ACTN|nr:ABC transporter permease [Micromonospora globispora]PWU45898.1 ribose ABC transporter permease [Micromonospora globispora]PWU59215.1 ribose ABC transporter permease [Micromonospora globispora]RQX05964.1 ribose ABC transporter permease [Micromonospora globispora]